MHGRHPDRARCGSSACCRSSSSTASADVLFSPATPARSGAGCRLCSSFTTSRLRRTRSGFPGAKASAVARSRGSRARRARRVITDSDFSKREITRHLGIDSSRIEVIYLGASALHQTARNSSRANRSRCLSGRSSTAATSRNCIEGFRRLAARMPEAAARDRGRQPHQPAHRDRAADRGQRRRRPRALAVVRLGRRSRRSLRHGVRVRVSLGLRRLRPDAARSDGRRHPDRRARYARSHARSTAPPRSTSNDPIPT